MQVASRMSPSLSSSIHGTAALARALIAGEKGQALWAELSARSRADPTDADALFDLSLMLRLSGRVEESLALQAAALELRSVFTCRHNRPDPKGQGALNVLVMVTAADVMANAPIDFLCEDADVTLHVLHLDAKAPLEIPPHDVAFVAVGLADANRPMLEGLGPVLKAWAQPVMNGAPERVLAMTRDGAASLFADCPTLWAPTNLQVTRAVAAQLAAGALEPQALAHDFAYPMLIRPLDTHGGKGLERIEDQAGWWDYLDRHPDAAFYLSPYVDYSDAHGWFPKLRITFIDGRAYPTHMALSDHWLAHYISAGMLESAEKRACEAAWMASFDRSFAVRHRAALDAIATRYGVDYFSIDCAETQDGRLLLFEADVASLVHALDPLEVFPYKRPAMDALFAAFHAALQRRARGVLEQAA